LDFPPELPISARAEEIVAAIASSQVLILAGETGSGKTTQIPKMCLAAGRGTRGRIACTQPRRVAALSISRRVAEELGVEWGREVGCKVRFSDQTSSQTLIKFLTDGMLLAEVQGDPMLRAYDTIIIDEAHERSLNIDFLLGHLRELRHRRPELKIIITSATIDTQAFSQAFDDAPIIEVSGRTYPVETVYLPLDSFGSDYVEEEQDPDADPEEAASAKAEAWHYVDGAVEAVLRVLERGSPGDILVFMPSERDIREAADSLEDQLGRDKNRVDLIPLFGRLSNAEQQRVFAPSQRRKIILATNIAETSLTIPGIRTVIDTGLARLSRYSPQARTRRLPIEAVSQSSADQRKGRAGRVADGLCIRLYSEEDFLARPRFTQPEIQRANLADVILRLKAFGLGDVERFPFINPPAGKAIRAGYLLLQELGAIVEGAAPGQLSSEGANLAPGTGSGLWTLTDIGAELARLPVDPTVGRMILQARREHCLQEVLVIAAGLSIQDPRERPLDKQAQADAAHRRFSHPDSDFLTLLNIWETYQTELENLSQGRLRRFCREHFLSYVRMREWRDIHSQLIEVLRERRDFRLSSVRDRKTAGEKTTPSREGPSSARRKESAISEEKLLVGSAGYRAIHRCILSGLLGNIACYDDESRLYKATNDRRVSLFPGSVLFSREERKKRPAENAQKQAEKASKTPRWIMASEIVETSRVYARTCAKIDPRWVLDLGAHVLKFSHSDPFWSPESGRVLVKQKTRLHGMEIETRAVAYVKINPLQATEILIREGLVNDTITWPFEFLAHNRRVREKIEFSLTRMRDSSYLNLDEALYRFYAARLMPEQAKEEEKPTGLGSVAELVDFVRHRLTKEPRFLMIEPEDLRDPESLEHDTQAFPESLPMENRVIPINYAYKPGQSDDGVTLDVNVRDASSLTEAALDWAVPGYCGEKVEHYLRALPKELRRAFIPLSDSVPGVTKAVESLSRLRGGKQTLTDLLAEHLRDRFGLRFDARVWDSRPLPDHLRVRVRVCDDQGNELCASRELSEIRTKLEERQREVAEAAPKEEPALWRRARARWEKPESETWSFGDIPSIVEIGEQAGLSVLAYPALKPSPAGVSLKLMAEMEEASVMTRAGLTRLLELQLSRDLGWLERDLRALRQIGPQAAIVAPLDRLQEDAFVTLRNWLCSASRVASRPASAGFPPEAHLFTLASFEKAVNKAREDMKGLIPRLVDLLKEVVDLRQTLLAHAQPYPGMTEEVMALVPGDFLRTTPYGQWQHLARFLKAKRQRAERFKQNPIKDKERAQQVGPYARKAATLGRSHPLYWLVEEFRVSVFAQELGTSESVSSVKLDKLFLEAGGLKLEQAEQKAPSPESAKPAPTRKATKIKSLDALGGLLR